MYEWRNIAARSRNVFTTSAILNTIQLKETALGVLYVSDDNMIYLSLHVKCLIVVKFWFYRQVFHTSFQYQNSQKSVQWEPRFIHADGQTDRWYMVKLVGVFRDVSSNAATNIRLYGTQTIANLSQIDQSVRLLPRFVYHLTWYWSATYTKYSTWNVRTLWLETFNNMHSHVLLRKHLTYVWCYSILEQGFSITNVFSGDGSHCPKRATCFGIL